jgi:copper oxidase (laccase) domain-containing protein
MLARQRLQAVAVRQILGGGLCTYDDAERFYSYRRDGETGRLLSFIYRP